MYQDLKSKLAMYKSTQAATPAPAPAQARDSGMDIHDLLTGTVLSNDDGCCFVMENRYPLHYLHGGCRLGDALSVCMDALRKLFRDLDPNRNLSDFLFLDIETTGLSGGVGTVAFLIGIGYFTPEAFVLKQYFMRDYDEEPALLRALNEELGRHKGLVTFNGKSFDWNLLLTRYTYNRIKLLMKNPIHLDLLFPSRRLWKLKLDSCRLSVLEEHILGEHRVEDIPGAQIPSVYFKYLEDRNASEIKKVIRHNESDILSMVSLLTILAAKLENPLSLADGEEELLGLGKIFEDNGELDRGIGCFESCARSERHAVKQAASRKLSGIYKRTKNYEKAVAHWESMLSSSGAFDLFALTELAKYYEHKEKDVFKALELVEKAIGNVLQMGLKNSIHLQDLKKRQDRLKRKAGNLKDG